MFERRWRRFSHKSLISVNKSDSQFLAFIKNATNKENLAFANAMPVFTIYRVITDIIMAEYMNIGKLKWHCVRKSCKDDFLTYMDVNAKTWRSWCNPFSWFWLKTGRRSWLCISSAFNVMKIFRLAKYVDKIPQKYRRNFWLRKNSGPGNAYFQ